MTIKTVHQDHKGYFQAIENDVEAGRLTFSRAGETRFILDHTEVNPDFSGQGVGKKLVLEAVALARKEGVKIIALCPFATSVFKKNPDLQDVLS